LKKTIKSFLDIVMKKEKLEMQHPMVQLIILQAFATKEEMFLA
jgi:hypothetical protein